MVKNDMGQVDMGQDVMRQKEKLDGARNQEIICLWEDGIVKDDMGYDSTEQYEKGQDYMGQDYMGKDDMGQDEMGQDDEGQDEFWQDHMGQENMG